MSEQETEVKPPAPKPEPETEASSAPTEYIILIADEGRAGTWLESTKVTARGAQSAVRQYAEKNGEGRYVAVPVRSFVPVSVTKKTVERLTFS